MIPGHIQARAVELAREHGEPIGIWQQTGGTVKGKVIFAKPNRFMLVKQSNRAPRYIWTLVDTVPPQ